MKSEARQCWLARLRVASSVGEPGKIPPIHKHFGDKVLEEAAFSLKAGDVSGLLEMKDGTYVILLCEKHLPADKEARFETEIEAGAVFVNGMTISYPELPFGGIKNSGFGRELAAAGIREFCNLKTVWER